MKTIKLAVVSSVFLLAACQKPKNWKCTCDVKPLGSGTTKTVTRDIANAKQNDANSICGDFGRASVNGNGSWKCVIKEQ